MEPGRRSVSLDVARVCGGGGRVSGGDRQGGHCAPGGRRPATIDAPHVCMCVLCFSVLRWYPSLSMPRGEEDDAGGQIVPFDGYRCARSLATAVVQALQNSGAISALDLLATNSQLDYATVEALCELGYVRRSADEFGECVFSLDDGRLDLVNVVRCGRPVSLPMLPVPDPMATTSKLELVAGLLQRGYVVSENPPERLLPTDDPVMSKRMLMRSTMYWRAMWMLPEVFQKGAQFFAQNSCEGYYLCLLRLSDLRTLYARSDFDQLHDKHFKLLADGKVLWASIDTTTTTQHMQHHHHRLAILLVTSLARELCMMSGGGGFAEIAPRLSATCGCRRSPSWRSTTGWPTTTTTTSCSSTRARRASQRCRRRQAS